MQTLWTFKTRNFTVSLACEPETSPDLSWDDSGEAAEKIASGEWDCVTFRVAVYGPAGEELSADYLGNSIYADVNEFRREHIGARGAHGSYFRDMVANAVKEARGSVQEFQSIRIRESAR